MKIIITSTVMPIRGGVGSHIDTISKKFNEMGHKVSIINAAGGTKKNFKIFSYKLIKFFNPLLKNDLLFIASFLMVRFLVMLKVAREIGKDKDVVVHVHDINAFNGVYKLCKRLGVRLVLTVHGFLIDGCIAIRKVEKDTYLGRFLHNAELKAFKNAEQIITIASYHYDSLKSIVAADKLHLIRNFIDFNIFYPYDFEKKKELRKEYGCSEKDFILLYAGRLEKSKGLDYVLQALSQLKEEMGIKFIIAGNGGEMDNLKCLVQNNTLSGKVEFLGEVKREKLVELYNLSNAFMMVSVMNEGNLEGTSVALIEAMACGLPVITTDVGGLKDIIAEIGDDMKVIEKNSNDIADKIKRLHENKGLQQKLSERVFKSVKDNYSLDKAIEEIYSVYLEK